MCELEKGDYFIILSELIVPSGFSVIDDETWKGNTAKLVARAVWVDKWSHTIFQVQYIDQDLIQARLVVAGDFADPAANKDKNMHFRVENLQTKIITKETVEALGYK